MIDKRNRKYEFVSIVRQYTADAPTASTNTTIELAAAGCVETGSPKGFPETRKPQASV